MNITEINGWDSAIARAAFCRCCGSTRWTDEMVAARPFASPADALEKAARIWWELDPDEMLEAFAAHPKIGDLNSLRAKFATTAAWAVSEQAGAIHAPEDVLIELASKNHEYEQRFGYIFIVCATGKSAEEMLALLNERLENDAAQELTIAAREQVRITQIRLEKITS